jgi:hypothetical protein
MNPSLLPVAGHASRFWASADVSFAVEARPPATEQSRNRPCNRRREPHSGWIAQGKHVLDDRDAWSEHQPSSRKENDFIRDHGWGAYARCYLGINEDAVEGNQGTLRVPVWRLRKRSIAVAFSPPNPGAGKDMHADIETAVAHLHGMLDSLMGQEDLDRGRARRPWPRPT